MKIGNRRISTDDPCYIIAEIGVNHNGDAKIAHEMIDVAKKASADAVKFQTFKADDLATASAPKAEYQFASNGADSQLEMLKALELSPEIFKDLRDHCRDSDIDFISTAFDSVSLGQVISLEPACLKWPSGELNNLPLLRQAAASAMPIILSTGMANLSEIEQAIHVLSEHGAGDIAILQCVSNYPARIEDQNLRAIPILSRTFGKPTGFSDHTQGIYAAVAAKALGMAILEKHLTLDKNMPGPDHGASIEPEEFALLVKTLRQIEAGLGDGVKQRIASENAIADVARKSLVYNRNLGRGHVLAEADFSAKRPGTGTGPDKLDIFIGMTLNQDVASGEMFKVTHVG